MYESYQQKCKFNTYLKFYFYDGSIVLSINLFYNKKDSTLGKHAQQSNCRGSYCMIITTKLYEKLNGKIVCNGPEQKNKLYLLNVFIYKHI